MRGANNPSYFFFYYRQLLELFFVESWQFEALFFVEFFVELLVELLAVFFFFDMIYTFLSRLECVFKNNIC